jgi:ERCC4-type nuclease
MIYIDSRESLPGPYSAPGPTPEGAAQFLALFSSHRSQIPASIRTLPAADFSFAGHSSLTSMIGIERKLLKGLLSDKRSGRFSGEQLPKLFDLYDPSLCFLLLESDYRVNDAGYLEERFDLYTRKWWPTKLGNQAILAQELDSFLTTLSLKTPITIKVTRNPSETVDWICGLYRYFQEPLSKRHDHMALHVPPQHALLSKASTVRRVTYALTNVGWERSHAVAERVKRVYCGDRNGTGTCCLVHMERKDWSKVPGFGPVLSDKVVRELRGEDTNDIS